jgi:hypothetical protein
MPDVLDPLSEAGGADTVLGDAAWLGAMVGVEAALVNALASEQLVPEWMTAIEVAR